MGQKETLDLNKVETNAFNTVPIKEKRARSEKAPGTGRKVPPCAYLAN